MLETPAFLLALAVDELCRFVSNLLKLKLGKRGAGRSARSGSRSGFIGGAMQKSCPVSATDFGEKVQLGSSTQVK